MPMLGLGTFDLRGDDCERAVAAALAMGYRHLDTAAAYGNETAVGRAIAASGVPREEIFLTTKVWYDSLRADALRRSADDSLARLGTEYVDLLLVHWPNDAVPLEESLAALAALEAAGKARAIGVSNFTVRHLRQAAASGAALVANEVEYHPYLNQDALLAEMRPRGMILIAYCPLAQGRVASDPTLAAIGARHEMSAAQVALRWLIQQPLVAAIPKAGSERHMAENLAVFDFALDEREMAAISALGAANRRLVSPSWAPRWDAA